MITDYMKQTGTWEVKTTSTDDYGNPVYETAVTIRGRFVEKLTNILSPTGSVLIGRWVVETDSLVNVGDKVNSMIVLGVSRYVDGNGLILASKVIT